MKRKRDSSRASEQRPAKAAKVTESPAVVFAASSGSDSACDAERSFSEGSDAGAGAGAGAGGDARARSRSSSPHTRRVNLIVPRSALGESSATSNKTEDPRYAVPTRAELNTLHSTAALYKSSLFKLQLDALGAELAAPYRKLKALESALGELKRVADAMPTGSIEADSGFTFLLDTPPVTRVLGSFMLRTAAAPELAVDVGLEMPATAFAEKDFINHRYTLKRAAFLSAFARHLAASSERLGTGLLFEAMHGDTERPLLVVSPGPDTTTVPGKTLLTKWTLRVRPLLPAGTFAAERLGPTRANVRKETVLTARAAASRFDAPTPMYNAAVLEDQCALVDLAALHKFVLSDAGPALTDAVLLAKCWVRRRVAAKAPDGLSGHLISMLCAHLLAVRRVTRASSAYQIFRAFVELLASGSLAVAALATGSGNGAGGALAGGVVFGANDSSLPAPVRAALVAYRTVAPVVFLDSTGERNLAAFVSSDALAELACDARRTLVQLDDPVTDGFAAVFMRAHNPELKYDSHMVLTALPMLDALPSALRDSAELTDMGPLRAQERALVRVLVRALGARALLVRLIRPKPAMWALGDEPPGYARAARAPRWVYFALDSSVAGSVVVHGPAADDADAASEFRAFWGDKSELRRFLDGSIREAVAWEAEAAAGRRDLIVAHTARFALERHCNVLARTAADDVVASDGSDDDDSTRGGAVGGAADGDGVARRGGRAVFGSGTIHRVLAPADGAVAGVDAVAASSAAIKALDSLGALLRSLDKLPLGVVDVRGAGAAFRYTAVYPPLAHARAGAAEPGSASGGGASGDVPVANAAASRSLVLEPLDVVVTFESSIDWPDDVAAVSHMKTALFIELGRTLNRSSAKIASIVAPDHLDVLFAGFAFRLRIHHRRLATLLARSGRASAIAQLNWALTDVPLLSTRLHTLQAAHPSFGPAARLVKHWAHAHMLSLALPDEALEALLAGIYLDPQPFAPPAAPRAGFLRALERLADGKFADEPLVVDFDSTLDTAARNEIQQRFRALRTGAAGAYALFIATSDATDGLSCTERNPSEPELARVQRLARTSLDAAVAALRNEPARGAAAPLARTLFTPSLEDYSLLVHLDPNMLPRRALFDSSVEPAPWTRVSQFKNLATGGTTVGSELLPGFEPASALASALVDRLGELFFVCLDAWGGDVIGLALRPEAMVPRVFTPAIASRVTLVAGSLAVVNMPAVIDEIRALGRELVVRIQVNRSSARL